MMQHCAVCTIGDGAMTTAAPPPELLTVRDMCDLLRMSRVQLYRRINAGTIPPPMHLGPKTPRWRRAAIEAWFDAAEREAAA